MISFPAAVSAAGAPETAKLEERLAALEAYVKNTAPDAAASLAGQPGPGHNGWMMTGTALVLFMTLPGLALFYGGLVRRKNVLSVLAQCFGIAGLATVLWWAAGFSLSFAKGGAITGGLDHVFLNGVTSRAGGWLPWVSDNVWAMYQLTFAIITPALIVGAIAERMKFSAILLFVTLWTFAVYYPFAHMMWGGGWFAETLGAIDFAGGLVVHISSGFSALALCLFLGPRLGYGREKMAPHSMVLCGVGTAILWVGWYGFNAGSAGAADGIAANAFTTTTLSAAVGGFVWGLLDYVFKGKPSVLGICSGIIGGLALVTPATGYITPNGAMLCGVVAGAVPYLFCVKLKAVLGYDDALDTFGVHAVGGTLGILLAGLLATSKANPGIDPARSLIDTGSWKLFGAQAAAAGIAIVWSVAATLAIAWIVKKTTGLRPSKDDERIGLDITDHGEEGYID
ncbi:MAG: ammonium transporter [Opitutaceae bacterium]|nr:ammonium transporter [Opitutaceae bacterium]